MISKYSVKKPFTVLVAVILVLVLGAVSVTRMTPDLLPKMSFPYIVLVTSYVGAAPEEVETTVTKPLEQSLAALDDLKQINSVSSENVSVVYLTFEDTVNVDRAMLDIQQAVTKLKSDWPEAVGNPTALELSTDLIPTVVAAVHYKDMDPIGLSGFASETLLPALEGTNGVASVNATGLVAERIEIELNKEKIDRLNQKLFGSIDEAAQEGFDKIDEGQQQIDEGRQELEDAKTELDKGEEELETGRAEANRAFRKAKKKLDSTKAELEAAIAKITGDSDLSPEEQAAALAPVRAALDEVNRQLAAIDGQLSQYGVTRSQLSGLIQQLEHIDDTIALLDGKLAEAKAGLAQVEAGYKELSHQKGSVKGRLADAQKQIDEGRQQIADGEAERSSPAPSASTTRSSKP